MSHFYLTGAQLKYDRFSFPPSLSLNKHICSTRDTIDRVCLNLLHRCLLTEGEEEEAAKSTLYVCVSVHALTSYSRNEAFTEQLLELNCLSRLQWIDPLLAEEEGREKRLIFFF